MGLDTTHGCWNGTYSSFNRWRCIVAMVAGLPPLEWMEGFYPFEDITLEDASKAVNALGFTEENQWAYKLLTAFCNGGSLPIKWECLKPSPLHILLHHSDCEGEIATEHCAEIAGELEKLMPIFLEEDEQGRIGMWKGKTQSFIDGLRLAHEQGESVKFH